MTVSPNAALEQQLIEAAAAFGGDDATFAQLLKRFAHDVERAMREPLEIFPVCHHSAASAVHMVRRLQERPPKVIFIELCEDLQPLVEHLADCELPVALQAFTAESEIISPEHLPASLVAPLTEASAEYQAIVYALTHPETQLRFVDYASDFVFQWDPQLRERPAATAADAEPPTEDAALHGEAIGVSVGALEPTFDVFMEFLLRNSNTRHFTEWWDQYVERAVINSDYATYRQVLFLVGSLLRHLGRRKEDVANDRLRERYMWTRMKQFLRESGIPASDAIYICGASHAASEVPEFGMASAEEWEIPERSATYWHYGILPSSYVAIEYQFGQPAGTVSLANSSWQKALRAHNLRAFGFEQNTKRANKPSAANQGIAQSLAEVLSQPPHVVADHEQLLNWSAQIVALARRNGYLASTADSIAIYQTALLLANMRNHQQPSAYDFQDAAITCLEKDRTPKKRTIAQLCQILLGGDRIGKVGYSSLPPLAQNVYDRLAALEVDLFSQTNQRALLDLRSRPDLRPCSDLLWKLRYLLGDQVVKPIVGERRLGGTSIQESWDIRIGKYQRLLITLGYEGVTLEQVLEQRLMRVAFAEDATADQALTAAEDALLYTNSPRLVRELGGQARRLLEQENSAAQATAIFTRARRLVQYYRGTPDGLPEWLQEFVATGYTHYTALLPTAFGDSNTTPQQIASMLGFIFTLESLALAMGCQRQQLLVSVQQASQSEPTPNKRGLLWATEWLLQQRDAASIRELFQAVLDDALRLPTLPAHMSGLILALTFAPGIARLVVELLSTVFGQVSDTALLPLLPMLIMQLSNQRETVQLLVKEASALFPNRLTELGDWQPAWSTPEAAVAVSEETSAEDVAVRSFLQTWPASSEALAAWIG
jgi:hypothetical protein